MGASQIPDVIDKLRAIQSRRLVAELCRRAGKTRTWFYKVLSGEASLLEHLEHVDDLYFAVPEHPVTAAREAAGLSQSQLADRLGLSRMTIYQWEHEESRQERVDRINNLNN